MKYTLIVNGENVSVLSGHDFKINGDLVIYVTGYSVGYISEKISKSMKRNIMNIVAIINNSNNISTNKIEISDLDINYKTLNELFLMLLFISNKREVDKFIENGVFLPGLDDINIRENDKIYSIIYNMYANNKLLYDSIFYENIDKLDRVYDLVNMNTSIYSM